MGEENRPKLHLSLCPLSLTEWRSCWFMYLTDKTNGTCRKIHLMRIELDGIHK